jgi:tRNA 2-thiouridine synthesizing protein A
MMTHNSIPVAQQENTKAVDLSKADQTVDTSGECCPVPLAKASRAMKTLPSGAVLELISTDIGSRMDIPAWCKRTGHELLRREEEGRTFHYFVRKRR